MKQVLQYPKRGGLKIADCPAPTCKSGGIVVANRYSLISAGTERAIIDLAEQSLVGKAHSRPDLVRQVIEKIRTEGLLATLNKVRLRLAAPIPLGYSSAGVVVEVSENVSEFAVGDRVACAGFGYASHADRIFVPKNLATPLPATLSFEEGAFVTLGAIALWGVRRAQPTIGERVAVIGLGLLGQITLQLLHANGCQTVAIDIDDARLEQAARFAPSLTVNPSRANAERAIRQFTQGIGVDAVIITAAAKSNQPVEFAGKIARDRARLAIVGDVAMDLPRREFYGKELSVSLSRSYGPGRYDSRYEERGEDYPVGYVRWTENRNMQAFLELVAAGRIDVKSLITETYDIESAHEAFARISAEKVLGILLRYPTAQRTSALHAGTATSRKLEGKISLGVCGAGNFGAGVLLPAVKKNSDFTLSSLYTATPHRARFIGDRFRFTNLAQSEQELLSDAAIDAVLIATPHNRHAASVIAALRAGKHVFVEKPLCLTHEELAEIIDVANKSDRVLMVGFNRRFAPSVGTMKKCLAARTTPAVISYTINAGQAPKDHWMQDDTIGGGRILGECCHFIDLIAHLLESSAISVSTVAVSEAKGKHSAAENFQIQLRYRDGSVASVIYTAMGDRSLPKETMQVFCGGEVLALDDFRRLTQASDGRQRVIWKGTQDKGVAAEITQFATAIRQGQSATLRESYGYSTLVTLECKRSLSIGAPITID